MIPSDSPGREASRRISRCICPGQINHRQWEFRFERSCSSALPLRWTNRTCPACHDTFTNMLHIRGHRRLQEGIGRENREEYVVDEHGDKRRRHGPQKKSSRRPCHDCSGYTGCVTTKRIHGIFFAVHDGVLVHASTKRLRLGPRRHLCA
jgi:hypothetical protein